MDLTNLMVLPSSLAIRDPEYRLMGVRPVSFAIVMDVVDDALSSIIVDAKRLLRDFLCERLTLECKEETIDEKYEYMMFYHEGVAVLNIPITTTPSLCHVTLFNSFDLIRCNKPLYKKFTCANKEGTVLSLLSDECGPVNSLIGDALYLAETLVIEH